MVLKPLQFWWSDLRGRLPYRRHRDLEDRPRRLLAQSFSLVTLLLGAGYLAWLVSLTLRTRGLQDLLF